MNKEAVFLLSIVVDQKSSRLDDDLRGKFNANSFSGSYTSREDITEEYPILASSREEAIVAFRACTDFRGRIESSGQMNNFGKIEDALERAKRGNRRKVQELESEFEKVSAYIRGD